MTDAWPFYFTAFLGPFVQEDTAIIAAVTAFLHPDMNHHVRGGVLLAAMFIGLVVSDLWKYWIGFGARRGRWARSFARKDQVLAIGEKIVRHPGKTLMFVRFVPGTRIPAYIAAGFFGVPFAVFAFWIVVSGAVYVGVALGVLASVGVVAGKTGQVYVAVALVACVLIYGLTRLRKREIQS
jgi:membrane protein DedA with SNARE-associated domain